MNFLKFIGATLLIGTIGAVITGIVMKRNGKLDEFVEKFKNKKEFCDTHNEGFLQKNACMISQNGQKETVYQE